MLFTAGARHLLAFELFRFSRPTALAGRQAAGKFARRLEIIQAPDHILNPSDGLRLAVAATRLVKLPILPGSIPEVLIQWKFRFILFLGGGEIERGQKRIHTSGCTKGRGSRLST